jgi:tetratricopeptide (TPR) repeat protein
MFGVRIGRLANWFEPLVQAILGFALFGLVGIAIAQSTPAQNPSTSPVSTQRFLAPPAIRYSLVGVLPARIEQGLPADNWLPIALYENLTTMIWRTPGVRPMTRSPVGVVLGRVCPDFTDVCLANLTAQQHTAAAKQLYAEAVVSPIVIRSNGAYRLKLLLLSESGAMIAQLESAWKPGDLSVAQRLLFELTEQARQKDLIPKVVSQLASIVQVNDFDSKAAHFYSDAIREEWIQEKIGMVTPAAYKARIQRRVEQMKRATQIDTDYYGAWNALGFAYADIEQLDLASQAFKKALELQPGHIAPRAGLALVAQLQKDFGKAADLYAAAFLDGPGLPEMGELLTHTLSNQAAFSNQQRLDFSRSFRRYLAAQRPQAVWSQELALSWTEFNLDNNVDAEALARRVVSAMQQVFTPSELALSVSWGQANEVLGRALYDQDKEPEVPEYLEEAIRVFEKASQFAPEHNSTRLLNLYSTYVDTLETLKQYDSALEVNQKAALLLKQLHGEAHPKYINNQRIQARVLNKLKRYADAEKVIGPFLAVWSVSKELTATDRLRLLIVYTTSLEEQKKFSVSVPFMQQRLSLARELHTTKEGRAGDLPSALRDIGDTYYALKNYKLAITSYAELLESRRKSNTPISGTDAFLTERVANSNGHLNQVAQGTAALNQANSFYRTFGETLTVRAKPFHCWRTAWQFAENCIRRTPNYWPVH